MTTRAIRPVPADAYNEALFSAYLDADTLLNIHAIRGIHISWLYATLLDAETEEVIDEHRLRLDHRWPCWPIFLFVYGGKPLMFEPVTCQAWLAEWGEHDEQHMAVRMAEAADG